MNTLFLVIDTLVKAGLVVGVAMNIVPLLIYLERKLSAYIQGRIGPNRVNLEIGYIDYVLPASMRGQIPPALARIKLIPGSLQPLADAVKLAFKEEVIPAAADKLLYFLGPVIALLPYLTALAFIPFGTDNWKVWGSDYVCNLQIATAPGLGVWGLFAITALAPYGIACGGWGSGSKYPLMGAVRASAQLISYEVAMGMGLISVLVVTGTYDLQQIVHYQTDTFYGLPTGWLIWKQPVAALIVMVAMFAESNRLPFDLPEAEPELVAGFHAEYSGLKFALYFLGEYMGMIALCGLFTTVFLGGWAFPGLVDAGPSASELAELGAARAWSLHPDATTGLNALLSGLVFLTKLLLVLNFQVWIRWTLPRFRYDQLMNLGWKVLIPLSLINLVLTAVVLALVGPHATPDLPFPTSVIGSPQ